jgi:hypothetical protein
VDIASSLILAVDVLSGDAPDNTEVLALVVQAERNSALPVAETIGDCAYGDGATRQAFADADRVLLAKVPQPSNATGLFPKSAFQIDLHNNTVTCPGGQTTDHFTPNREGKLFYFGSLCEGCALRSQCTTARDGRTLRVHPQEGLLQKARNYAASASGRTHLREHLVVENRLGRLAQLGIGQARYFGHAKTGFQLLMAATIANLRRTWNWQQEHDPSAPSSDSSHKPLNLGKNPRQSRPVFQTRERFRQYSLAC